jgi:phenylalanyl-tRNA synthetase beta chain
VRVVYSWLRELCDPGIPVEEAAGLLVRLGFEVAEIHRPWDGVRGVIAAAVLDVRDHPRSDRLVLATLDTGTGRANVVAGVRNFRPGDVVPYAPPGSTVAVLPEPLGVRTLRGEPSEGMVCSPMELAVSADHGGIMVLPPEVRPGTDVMAWLGLAGDAVLELELEPNRPDMLSVLGAARELSAATGAPLGIPRPEVPEGPERAADAASLEVLDLERCPRYLARLVTGVTVGPSPLPVQARLHAAGMRPLSNVVDATNYAMLELGQPLHPFDLDLLAGKGIVVRRAEEGERLVTLDGATRELGADDLVIADRERAVAVAGVMGSAATEVSASTRHVLVESAHFAPTGVLRTARRLGLRTEAAVRFERGTDPEGVALAADRSAELMLRWAGGVAPAGALEAGGPPPRRTVHVRPSRAVHVLGYPVQPADVRRALTALFLAERPDLEEEGGRLAFEIPGHRPDLEREIDLIEEVARLQGYERIPSLLPGVRQVGGLNRLQVLRRRVQDALVGAGLFEARSSSFIGPGDLAIYDDERADGVRVRNPLSEDAPFFRTALLPGLLAAAARGVRHGAASVELFELGVVALPAGPADPGSAPPPGPAAPADPGRPREEEHVAAILAGTAGGTWLEPARRFDVHDAKGTLEVLLESLGIEGLSPGEAPGPPWHPVRSATVLLDGREAGAFGELAPSLARRWDLPERTAGFELRLAALVEASPEVVPYSPVPRYPPVRRDLAFVLDREVPAGEVEAALRGAAGDLLDSCRLFDLFEGPPVPPGRRSLAFALEFRAPERTLSDEEVDAVVASIVDALGARFGAELRTG